MGDMTPTTPAVSGLELRLRDTAQMRTQFPDWLLKEMEAAADHIADLQRQLAEARDALTTIRDSTFRTAIILRAIADRALKK